MRYKISIFIIVFPFVLFSQGNKEWVEFNERIKSNISTIKKGDNFDKIQNFFFEKEWDSTLVYTSSLLNQPNLSKESKDYNHFFRGYSFQMKKLFEEATGEFSQISSGFAMTNQMKMSLGEIALEKSQFKEALNYFMMLDSLNKTENLGLEVGSLKNNIGLCYMHSGKYIIAEPYLIKSVQIQELNNDNVSKLISAYGNLANTYYEQYKDELAIEYFLKAYQLARTSDKFFKKSNQFFHRQSTSKNMAVVEENRKNYIKALVYRKEYEQWKDSLNDQNRIYETAQLEKRIAVAHKQKEVNVLEVENKVKTAQNKVYLYSGVLLLVLLLILFTSYKGKVKRNQIITAQKEDLDELNATKDKLFSIVSHDLRSSVNAIKTSNKSLLNNLETEAKTDLKETLQQNSAIVNGAYGLLDNLLNWALLQTKQSYFKITSLRLYTIIEHVAHNYKPMMFEKNIAFENRVDKKAMIQADQESLKIILRNLLDNAVKFSKAGESIQVYSQEQGEYVQLTIEDSGIGMDDSTINELLKETQLLSKKKNEEILGTGLGLHLVKSMIQKNQGKFAIESTLEKGTKMIISLPKK